MKTMNRTIATSIVLLLAGLFTLGHADSVRHLATVLDGSGRVSTNTVQVQGITCRHVGAGAQPGGVATCTNGTYTHVAGFLPAVTVMRPLLDSDGDGAPDELEEDNDADGLTDATELGGTAFDPVTVTKVNTADTDEDGMDDGSESVAGTDPTNPDARLEITTMAQVLDTNVVVEWRARHGKAYDVLVGGGMPEGGATSVVGTVTVVDTNAPGPWYETLGAHTNAMGTNGVGVYRVRVSP